MLYIEALRKSANKLDAEFNMSKLITHAASKGAFREYIMKNIVRPYLPKRFGISGGECFDVNGAVSKQLDLVIYDDLYSYVIPYDGYMLFPFESIYGNVEIKSHLGKSDFLDAILNIESMKRLFREMPNACQVVPSFSINIEGVTWNSKRRHTPFGIVFSYSSAKPETVVNYFSEVNVTNKDYLPDLIVLFQEKTIICRIKYKRFPMFYATMDDDYDAFLTLPCGDDTLPIFISLILRRTSDTDLKLMNLTDLLNSLIDINLRNMGEQKVYRVCKDFEEH